MKLHRYTFSECITIASVFFHRAICVKHNPSSLEYFTIQCEEWFGCARIARRDGFVIALSDALELIAK